MKKIFVLVASLMMSFSAVADTVAIAKESGDMMKAAITYVQTQPGFQDMYIKSVSLYNGNVRVEVLDFAGRCAAIEMSVSKSLGRTKVQVEQNVRTGCENR